MSPEPYVRAQALVLAVLLVAGGAFGSPVAALALTVATAVIARWLYARYRGDVATARRPMLPARQRLDLIVAGDARAAVGVGLAANATLVLFGVRAVDVGVAPATPVLVAGAAAVVWLSSLFDWYLILPRVSGQLGLRPCRSPHAVHPNWPQTWREVTKWWYIHRIVTALVLRFSVSLAVTLTAGRHLDLPGGSTVVSAAAVGFLASYLAAVPRAVWEAGHPSATVGETVRVRAVERVPLLSVPVLGRRLTVPGFRRRPIGRPGVRHYVYDVALEGVDLVPVAAREGRVPHDEDGKVVFEDKPTKFLLKSLEKIEQSDRPFVGCRGERCSGINWYCLENPRCYHPK